MPPAFDNFPGVGGFQIALYLFGLVVIVLSAFEKWNCFQRGFGKVGRHFVNSGGSLIYERLVRVPRLITCQNEQATEGLSSILSIFLLDMIILLMLLSSPRVLYSWTLRSDTLDVTASDVPHTQPATPSPVGIMPSL